MNIDYLKATFGYIGFIPFAILAITPWIFDGAIAHTAIVFQIGYGAIILTFLGGLLFAFTFKKTKSTILVSIEHAIYGSWLFTIGMGAMLGFPT